MKIDCPCYDKNYPISPLNPNICVAPGKCNQCDQIKKGCKGCKNNMEKVNDKNFNGLKVLLDQKGITSEDDEPDYDFDYY